MLGGTLCDIEEAIEKLVAANSKKLWKQFTTHLTLSTPHHASKSLVRKLVKTKHRKYAAIMLQLANGKVHPELYTPFITSVRYAYNAGKKGSTAEQKAKDWFESLKGKHKTYASHYWY